MVDVIKMHISAIEFQQAHHSTCFLVPYIYVSLFFGIHTPAPPAELQQFFDLLPAAVHCRFVEGISEERGTEGPAVKRSGGFREKRGGYNGLGKLCHTLLPP